jgi:chromosome segregation ATPase
LADRQKRLDSLNSEYELKLKKLLDKEAATLVKSRESFDKQIEILKTALDIAKADTAEILKAKTQLENEIQELILQREDLFKAVESLKLIKETISQQVEKLNAKMIALKHKKASLEDSGGEVLAKLSESIDQLALSADKNEELKVLNSELTTKRDKLSNEIETIEADIEKKIQVKRIELEELVSYENRTREDLARQTEAIVERERVVTIRERKADSQEFTIQRNANLLDL